jgi:sigma-B regulation protein RsbU (phosphoserine phosphatase)
MNSEELFDLAAEGAADERLLHLLIDQYQTTHQLQQVVLYLEEEGIFRRVTSVESPEFPALLRSSEELNVPFDSFPQALLAYQGDPLPTDRASDPMIVSIAIAIRALRLDRRLKKQRFEVNYRGVELEALYDVGLAITSTLKLEKLGEEILLRAASLLDARQGALYLFQKGDYRLEQTLGGEACDQIPASDPQIQDLLGGKALPTQRVLPGATHLLAVPIETEGQARGVLVVADKESRQGVGPFRSADRRTLALFANQAAIALENAQLHRQALEKERLEKELELAADIQNRLLPTAVPLVTGYDLIGWSRSARLVGGDYYNLLPLAADKLGAVVADVSGKGMPAALMVSTLHSALGLLMDRVDIGADLISRLNRHIATSSAPNKFITLFIAELDPEEGLLNFVNAGHNPALLLRSSGNVEELEPKGMPLGIFADGVYQSESNHMSPGDLLCVYSDGITEAESPQDEQFGMARLVDLLRKNQSKPLPEIIDMVDQRTTDFAAGRSQGDDQTVLIVRRLLDHS